MSVRSTSPAAGAKPHKPHRIGPGSFQKNALSARVVTTRGEVVGLSIDTFMHHKNDFGHPWNPAKYAYCWSGWGAYNFNAYFLHTGVTKFADNFGRSERFREQFAGVVKALAAPVPPEPTPEPKPVDDNESPAGMPGVSWPRKEGAGGWCHRLSGTGCWKGSLV
jgi:hypothetical protein